MEITLHLRLKRRRRLLKELSDMMERSDTAQSILAGPAPPVE